MQESKARELIRKYREGILTEEERAFLESWYLEVARTKPLKAGKEEIAAYLDAMGDEAPFPLTGTQSLGRPLRAWMAVAASVLVLVLAGMYRFYYTPEPEEAVVLPAGDALPGENRALLTLASGQRIPLDGARSGKLAQEGNTAIVKVQDGEIVYNPGISGKGMETGPSVYNMIETPKAGQYKVRLPDGSQVWLNAASSIRFPTEFQAAGRMVEVRGEVYFEVAKAVRNGQRIPFRVLSGNQVVEVLGTRFNVNSYADEDVVKTTLLEGSIQVRRDHARSKSIVLKPGQQAQLLPGKSMANGKPGYGIEIREVDTGAVVAWKEGYFRFDGAGLPELMRQLSRWYDMEVVYEGPIGAYEFVGQIERNAKLSKVLKILEIGGVQFRVEGRKIIVTE